MALADLNKFLKKIITLKSSLQKVGAKYRLKRNPSVSYELKSRVFRRPVNII